MPIPAEKLEIYHEGLRRRLLRPLTDSEQTELDKAYAEAKYLAHMLVKEHGAKGVWLFGSIARRRPLRPDSDIDLAVEGMPSEIYYQLVGDLQTESGRSVDLVRLENVPTPVKRVVFSEGIILKKEILTMKRVLILGAGLVTGPIVRYLLDKGYHVTVASRTVSKAEALVGDHPNGEAIAFDVESDVDGQGLANLVSRADLAVSFLPFIYHVAVAKECLAQGKPMVTTSYVSPAMRELDVVAKEAGIIILNEVGLDPGTDHMSAMKIIHGVQQAGGHVDGFMSYCGGLPAPEANDNPLGYKFSWSPRGVLLAARNAGHYLRDGQEISVSGEELFKHYWSLEVEGLGQFEAFPNRDSVPYRETYGIEDINTMYRGTLRNAGWCDTLDNVVKLGFLDEAERAVTGLTYAQFMRGLLPSEAQDTGDIKADMAAHLDLDPDSDVIKNLDWLGLFAGETIEVTGDKISPLDLLTKAMLDRMEYAEGERDLIILVHHFDASYPDRAKEHITSTLVAYGEPGGDSAMARTVSLPAAIAVDLILRGDITATGIQVPVTPDLYEPILAGLKELGIEFVEKVETNPNN